ncbi:MAG: phospholipase D-like domain-containing protein, partial [Planctomycetota bacterium]|nr:phospholipase D-like domain-containing protein [Planctomycetota bacterium]
MRLLIVAVLIVFTAFQSVDSLATRVRGFVSSRDEYKPSAATASKTDDGDEPIDERTIIRLGASLVATHPMEFEWDNDFQETQAVWNALIDGSESSLDLAFFYASDRGEGGDIDPDDPTSLSGVFDSLLRAADRGVAIRFLVDSAFEDTYPALVARLGETKGVESRVLNLRQLTGGVMHAKYMIADSKTVYTGSANFDWRSLEHVLELGMTTTTSAHAGPFVDVFNLDWHLAGGGTELSAPKPIDPQPFFRPALRISSAFNADSGIALITPVFSPKGLLPNEDLWDLPHIIERIEGAKERVWIQVMTFRL